MAIYTLERLRTSSCLIYGDGCWRIPGVPLFSAHIDTGKLKRVGSLTHINRGERWVGKNQRIAFQLPYVWAVAAGVTHSIEGSFLPQLILPQNPVLEQLKSGCS